MSDQFSETTAMVAAMLLEITDLALTTTNKTHRDRALWEITQIAGESSYSYRNAKTGDLEADMWRVSEKVITISQLDDDWADATFWRVDAVLDMMEVFVLGAERWPMPEETIEVIQWEWMRSPRNSQKLPPGTCVCATYDDCSDGHEHVLNRQPLEDVAVTKFVHCVNCNRPLDRRPQMRAVLL